MSTFPSTPRRGVGEPGSERLVPRGWGCAATRSRDRGDVGVPEETPGETRADGVNALVG